MARVTIPAPGDGPIPGENFTSDTRNYPWHRAPDYTDLDDALEASFKKLSTKEGAHSLFTALQSDISVVQYVTMFCISGIGAGKWTPDFALLLAGPLSHVVKIMAEGAGIKYEMGLTEDHVPTHVLHNRMKVIDTGRVETAIDAVEEQLESILDRAENQEPTEFEDEATPTPRRGGFMAPIEDDE